MADFEGLHLSPPIAAAVARLGWSADDPVMRDSAPTAARGHNLVTLVPPVPAAATPALAGLLSRLGAGVRALLLAADSDLDEWAGRLHLLTADSALHVHVARGPGRGARRLRADPPVDLFVCSPATALALHRRSALRPETVSSVLLAWPEMWGETDDLAELMQDLPKEAQRIVVGSSEDEVAGVVERYARRALTVGAPGVAGTAEPAGPIRTVGVSWSRRVSVLPELMELLDPASAVVWMLDRGHEEAIRQAVITSDHSVQVTTGDAPRAQTIIAFDPPTPPRLRQLLSAGEVVVLTPPAAERYVRRIAATRRPLRLSGALDAAASAAEVRRAKIAGVLEKESLDRALLLLAPLLERYDGAAVAAALFELWTAAPATATPAPEPVGEAPAAIARIFVGLGKKDGATVNDLVAVLTKEVRIEREKIGRVELRDGFMLVEIPAQEAERVAAALNGKMIRRKRIVARIDKASGGSRETGRASRR